MNPPDVEAILFDMGGTLRISTPRDEVARVERVQRIMDLIGAGTPAAEFTRLLTSRAAAYKAWADENLIELGEPELWSRWMLPDWPADVIAPLGVKLNKLWIDANGIRQMIPGAGEVIIELFHRGYRLGLVSNTTSSTEAVQALRDLHIAGCFETIVLSCQYGRKKPHSGILEEAVVRMDLRPEACAYVGNDLHKDISAARQAGFSLAVLVRQYQSRNASKATQPPDMAVDSLDGLLELFPPRTAPPTGQIHPPVDASLSTMWAIGNFPSLEDFCEAARRLGFSKIELNHQVNSAMLDGLDLHACRVSSIHEPCPADISTETLRDQDWLISNTIEENRRKGLEAIRRSIDLAHRLGTSLVVVHAGNVQADVGLERELKALVKSGLRGSDEYQQIRERFMHQRQEMAPPRLEAVKRSLVELLEYAYPYGIRLGLENRYHYMDIPTADELEDLLTLAGPDQLGFWLDTGHAHVLDSLGLIPMQEWIPRFATRILGIHFHDAAGTRDHNAPGLGEIDFPALANLLPPAAQRTFEVKPDITAVQLKTGIQYLIEKGCVQTL